MLDFVTIKKENKSKNMTIVYPDFTMSHNIKDLMIRGGTFYAVWDEENGLWSKSFYRLIELVDKEILEHMYSITTDNAQVIPRYMKYESSGVIYRFTRFAKECTDRWIALDQKPIFLDDQVKRENYSSFRLPYSIDAKESGIEQYNTMMDTLYNQEERTKIEWAIGCCLSGEAAKVQKFVALYGGPGTGKSTVLHIVEKLLSGYISPFDAASLGRRSNAFSLDAFSYDPIVVIQHDADMSKIDDNTKFNSVVSHEPLTINEKFKKPYTKIINSFIFIGTNSPIKITEARSGLGRRLIDITPTGNKLSRSEYDNAVISIGYCLGGIAHHCLEVYHHLGPSFYDSYRPTKMFGLTNDIYSFIEDNYITLSGQDYISMTQLWTMYKQYAEDSNFKYILKRRELLNELQYYFKEYKSDLYTQDGLHLRKVFIGIKKELFDNALDDKEIDNSFIIPYFLKLKHQESIFDKVMLDRPAQYTTNDETPINKWNNIQTTLCDLDTSKLHYVKVPENHIVIDFDLKGDDGNKSLEKNLEAAAKWPSTYAETSKSGQGIHLHYIYEGDASNLSRIYSDNVEVKVFTGNSSLRRKLTLCNDIGISTINSGLPLKGEKKMMNFDGIKNEKVLRSLIKNNINKQYVGYTKPSIELIFKDLEEAFASGIPYDVSDMRNAVLSFAASSSNQSDYCVKKVNDMKFKSVEPSNNIEEYSEDKDKLIFYDIEVFPNLLLVNWKIEGEGQTVVRMINPSPSEIEELTKFKLVGFNCRRYDNHILYARMMGYTNEQLYNLSQKIINKGECFFGEAYNLSYTDVYDFSSKKQSLKKFEIELGIHHQELGLPWDQTVPEDKWDKVAEYCDNDVIATEAVFNARKADFIAREILADVAGMTVNDTTNSLTTRIIFGNNRNPQNQFNYRDLGCKVEELTKKPNNYIFEYKMNHWTVFNIEHQPVFPGYIYENGVSTYRDEKVGEGGYVYSEPGMYSNVALLDIASMHPSSIVAETLFGEIYTEKFKEILDARLAIKHQDFEKAKTMLNGSLAKYLTDKESAKALASALKIAINSVYGLTSARFNNPFRDIRNIDNIVAKRGALFMINLKHEVQNRGFTVAHIKTDSIKIPDATPEIIEFVVEYGKLYGYNFEHEATYDRMCLVNDAVYISKEKNEWSATGKQFQVPYVFKTLFSKEPIIFEDMCETKSVTTELYLDMNESLPEGEHNYIFVGKVGRFCPIKNGFGGGELLRHKNGKYDAATGTKGYKWLESEVVQILKKENDIDRNYYNAMVDSAIETISEFGDFEWFTKD